MTLALAKALDSTAGERLDFEQIYRAHESRVWGWAVHLLGPRGRGEAEDVVQDVFLALHRQLAGFRGEAEIGTWLFRTTANIVSRRRRRERVRAWFTRRTHDPAPLGTTSLTTEGAEARDTVYRVLDDLDERSRALLIWFEIEGLSGTEIAQLLDLKIATVWVRLHRARAAFRERLMSLEAS